MLRTIALISCFLTVMPLMAITVIDPVEPGVKAGWYGELEGDVSLSNGDTDKSSYALGGLLGWGLKKQVLFLNGSYEYGKVDKKVDTDKSFLHLRHLFNLKWKGLAWESFFQLGRDDISFIERRSLVGGGLRQRWVPVEGLNMYFGLGAMDEQKDFKAQTDIHETLGNVYLSAKGELMKESSLLVIGYFQPRLSDPSIYDSIVQSVYRFPISQRLSFKFKISYRHTDTPAAGKTRDNTSSVVGLSFTL